MHYSLRLLKVTSGLLGLSAVWSRGGVINHTAEDLSTSWPPTSRVLCMPAGLREWVHSVPSRQGIYSLNLQVCWWLAAIAKMVSTSVCLACSLALCPIFQTGMLACATSSQSLGPFDRQTVGNKTSWKRGRWRRKRTESQWCPRRVSSGVGAASLRIMQRWV